MSIDPIRTYMSLAPDGSVVQLPGAEAFWSRPPTEVDELGRHWLVSEFECAEDWPHWEMHPAGDELVYLLAGEVSFQLQEGAGITRVHLEGRAALVVPKGVWHTAKVLQPSRLLFITLGAGTQHRAATEAEE
jgi:hypothetical protein